MYVLFPASTDDWNRQQFLSVVPVAALKIIYAELRARVPRPRHPPQRQVHWRDVRGWHRPAAGQQHRRLATPQHVRAHPKPHAHRGYASQAPTPMGSNKPPEARINPDPSAARGRGKWGEPRARATTREIRVRSTVRATVHVNNSCPWYPSLHSRLFICVEVGSRRGRRGWVPK